MVPAIAETVEFDLEEVEAAVGARSFERGSGYARKGRVLSLRWDDDGLLLSGRVVGNGALYDTSAYFSSNGTGIEFDRGECSCPIGWNCKHVAALAVVAADPPAARTVRRPPPVRLGSGSPRPARPEVGWEEPLSAIIAAPVRRATGTPMAIELTVAVEVSGSTARPPRLQARLMRPGARGGWVNGSLRWGSLESWNLQGSDYREDHLDLAREFHAVHQARMAMSSRYHYGYGDREKYLDLTDWEASQLWPLFEQAASLGMLTLHAEAHLGDIPRYRRGEVVLDVTAAAGGAVDVAPTLRLDGGGDLGGFSPLLFLGAGGHGMLLAADDDRSGRPPGQAPNGVGAGAGALRLVRLVRKTPAELQQMLLSDARLKVPVADLERFASRLAPSLRNVAPVVSSDGAFVVPEVSPPELVLRVEHDQGHMTRAAWGWTYSVGGSMVDFGLAVNGEGPGCRDVEAEREILDGLDLSGIPGLGDLALIDADGRPAAAALLEGFDTVRFVSESLPALEQAGTARTEVSGEPQDYRNEDGSLQIGVSTQEIAGERDWFDLDVTITLAGRELAFGEIFAALARGETRMLLDDGAHFSLLAPELQSLRELIEEARALGDGGRPGTLRISRYQAGLWQELVGLGVVRRQAQAWQRQVEGLSGLTELARRDPPGALEAELRPYQLEGFNWLAALAELGLGGILADDMGLGKTLQALALICHAGSAADSDRGTGRRDDRGGSSQSRTPFLVVAPTSVVPNWVSEAERFAPGLAVLALTDTLARAGVAMDDVVELADVVVTTYTLARLDDEHYGSVDWAGVILDEAQAVKNRNSKTHAAVRRLSAPFKLAITGTPMENNLGELWALLSIAAPGLFPDPKAFDRHYARPIERQGDSERLARLRRRIRPLVMRRTKELVAADLPAKQEQSLEVALNPRHRRLYDTHLQRERQRILGLLEDYDRNRFSILTAITRLRQLSLHPGLLDKAHMKVPAAKLDALSEQLADVVGGGHRALVFSQFTGFLGLARKRLQADGIGHCYLDGRTRNREKVLRSFKEGEDPVFLISLKAGGVGLNLTEADYCFLLDPWWNPAVETQAIDRVHRIGQDKRVMVYRLVSADTIEQKVIALAQRKAALFTGVMDDGDLFAAAVTAADIRGLLS